MSLEISCHEISLSSGESANSVRLSSTLTNFDLYKNIGRPHKLRKNFPPRLGLQSSKSNSRRSAPTRRYRHHSDKIFVPVIAVTRIGGGGSLSIALRAIPRAW